MKTAGFVVLAAVVLTVLTLQHRQLNKLRVGNQEFARQKGEADTLRARLAEVASPPVDQDAAGEIVRLREANRDLLKLRNEVRGLREQKAEYDRLLAENARLRSSGQIGSAASERRSMAPIHIRTENLSNQGFLTPEATVQTLYWAKRETNEAVFAQCFTPESVNAALFIGDRLSTTTAIEIFAHRTIAADVIKIGIRIYKGDSVHNIAVTLRLVGNEWKLDGISWPVE
jgi:hypothetical protein